MLSWESIKGVQGINRYTWPKANILKNITKSVYFAKASLFEYLRTDRHENRNEKNKKKADMNVFISALQNRVVSRVNYLFLQLGSHYS